MNQFKIKPSMVKEWQEAAGKNCMDGYSFGVVQATVKVFEALDDPKVSAEEALTAINGMGITGFMAGCMAQWVGKFHERGDEFRKHWNLSYGIDEDKAKGGTVNPAILTIGESNDQRT